ncbi:hypothetical protein, partial [Pseudomonas aeruginosa]
DGQLHASKVNSLLLLGKIVAIVTMDSGTFTSRSKAVAAMDDVEQLLAQVEAQACVINHVLVACMRHGIIEPQARADECRARGT